MTPTALALLVLAGPLAAFAAIGGVPTLRRTGRPAGWVSIAGVASSLAAAGALLAARGLAAPPVAAELRWIVLAEAPAIRFGLLLDGVALVMLVLVSLVALVVQVYSLAYMAGEKPGSFGRYFAYQSLFAFAMLGLVASHNLVQTFIFWELVGLGSYLLIGFWYERPAAARAALKAFWTTRLGDVGLAVGVVVLGSAAGTFVFGELFEHAAAGRIAHAALLVGVAGLYVGAMGKSAQFPLHIWLPDAMEGPTPVSALIHAATMVAAGVYLMVRVAPLLALVPELAAWVLAIGALTALLAALLALVERDIKRVLAYSTVSQLGNMMAAVGAGAAGAAFFHLCTHALFKALLFLAAGSVIHALETNDLFAMGGLARRMPATAGFLLVGGLALAGCPPTAGFYSKESVLAAVLAAGHPLAFAVLVLTAGLTAFYMTRAFVLACLGAPRTAVQPHEAPPTMLLPMALLALGTLVAGLAGPALTGASETGHAGVFVPIVGLAAALAGGGAAWLGYARRSWSPARAAAVLTPLTLLLERRYYLDDLAGAAYRGAYLAPCRLLGWLDRYVVDGAVNGLTAATATAAARLRRVQNGRVQDALYALVAGLVVLMLLTLGA